MERKYPGDIRNLALKIKGDLTHMARKVEIAGSIRRKVVSPRDIDMLVIPRNVPAIQHYFERRGEVTSSGLRRLNAVVEGVQVNVMFTEPVSWGAAMMHFTGPKGANINNRKIASGMGYILNEYGLFYASMKRIPGTDSERGVYKALKKVYREPEDRGKSR